MESIEKETRDTRFFGDRERDEIFMASEKLAHLVKEGGVQNVIFVDSSARPISMGLTSYWHKAFPKERLPGIYFINPDGLHPKNPNEKEFDQIERLLMALLGLLGDQELQQEPQEFREKKEVPRQAVDRLQEVHKHLMQHKDQPTLVVDTCLHTGSTVQKITQALGRCGFTNVSVAAVSPDPGSSAQADEYLLAEQATRPCYPFGPEGLIEKGDDVISHPTKHPDGRIVGNRVRAEIKDIIKKKLDSANED